MGEFGVEHITAVVMLIALVVYVLLGGADFGGGVWDLLAKGPRKLEQRAHIHNAIGPIWEANHVWLIIIVVLGFTGFPPAYAAVLTALHIPVALMLLGVVFRGTAFVFRTYDREGSAQRRWGIVFSISSVLTPMLLGVTLGTIAGGSLHWNEQGVYESGFFRPWLTVFPWSVGLFTLCIFALLAAVYLSVETTGALRDDFRKRAIGAWIAVAVMGIVTWILALTTTRHLGAALTEPWWSWPLRIATGLIAVAALWAIITRRVILARTLTALQVTFIIAGFGLAQYPYLVVPQFTIENSAAPPITHELLLAGLAAGAIILLPSLWYLYTVFKGRRAFAMLDQKVQRRPT